MATTPYGSTFAPGPGSTPASTIKTISKDSPVYGYKGMVRKPDGTYCRHLKYEKGLIYVSDSDPKTCSNGFHFCEKLHQVFPYYDHSQKDHVFFKVRAWGNVDYASGKLAAQYIEILDEVDSLELLTAKLKKHLDDAYTIQKANKNAVICGSLALIIRGWIPYRPIHDLDIMMPYYSEFMPVIKNPSVTLVEEIAYMADQFGESGNETMKMSIVGEKGDTIDFDLFINPKETWNWITIDGRAFKVANVQMIIEAKMKYYMGGQHKHGQDLIQIMKKVDTDSHGNPRHVFLDGSVSLYPLSTLGEIEYAKI